MIIRKSNILIIIIAVIIVVVGISLCVTLIINHIEFRDTNDEVVYAYRVDSNNNHYPVTLVRKFEDVESLVKLYTHP